MATSTSKKLQVFISSTCTDLLKERQAAVEAVLTSGHIPAGMELFTAGDESQMHVIENWIDESDVYMLILGGRYGSVEPTSGKSYTQLEYEYAIQRKKPLFALVIEAVAIESLSSNAVEQEETAKLAKFRSLVLTNVVEMWSDEKDIKIAIGKALKRIESKESLLGWVRP